MTNVGQNYLEFASKNTMTFGKFSQNFDPILRQQIQKQKLNKKCIKA